MKKVKKLNDNKIYAEITRILTIANDAVKKAKEENKKLGIPETFWNNGKVYYILSSGEITQNPPPIMRES